MIIIISNNELDDDGLYLSSNRYIYWDTYYARPSQTFEASQLVLPTGYAINTHLNSKFVFEEVSYANISISTRSGSGNYYTFIESRSKTGYTLASITIIYWAACTGPFTMYYQDGKISAMAATTTTVGALNIRILWIK